MERMTRSMIAAWQPANPLVEPTRAERLAQESLTLMDERDACARRLAAATAALGRIAECACFCELEQRRAFPVVHEPDCSQEIARAFLTEAAAPHGPGAARGA